MREAGNLALEPVLTQGLEGLDWSKPSPTLARRVLLDESSTARMMPLEEKARQVRRNLAIRRVRSLVSLILVVLTVTGVFGLIVYRQARILEQNFANLKLERTIDKTMQSTGQLSEQLARQTNLEQIRQQAIDRLGLQTPAGQQLYVVDIPNSDRVVYASASTLDTSNEAVLADVFVNIEGFFKTLKIPGQTS